jgi:hypothetical protein
MGEITFKLTILGHRWIHFAVHRLRDTALRNRCRKQRRGKPRGMVRIEEEIVGT